MNLDELRSVQSTERKKDSLQNLRPSFYQEVGEYISDLEDERDRIAEQAEDPFSSPEVGRLTDEIETAKDVVEAVYERRMGKLVKQASLAAAGMPANDEGLTAEEQDLFADLVSRIESNKSRVLDVLEGELVDAESTTDDPSSEMTQESAADIDSVATSSAEADPESATTSNPDPTSPPEEPTAESNSDGLSPAAAMGGGPASTDDRSSEPSEPQAPPEPTPSSEAPPGDRATEPTTTPADEPDTTGDVDRMTVKITQDIGSILGVDAREYTLSADDVVTLPEENATPLVEREAAERLE